jgi:hypothetical protein
VLDRRIRLAAAKRPHRPAGVPRGRQVRIERERPIDQRDRAFEVARHVTEREPAERQRDRVILAQLRCQPGQPRGFRNLVRAIGGPAVDLAHHVAEPGDAIGRGEFGIELARLAEQRQRLGGGLARQPVNVRHPAQEIVVGVEALGRLARGPLDFGLLELRRDRADHARGHLILQIEDVFDAAVEMVGPQMRAGRNIDELRRDAHPLRQLAHAAFEHVAHAQLSTDLLHVHGPSLVGEARVARDHEQPADVTERGDDVLDHAVGEVVLPGVVAHVLEGQDGDRRLVRKRRLLMARINEANEAIAAARHGNHVALPGCLFLQRLPQGRDLDLQVVFLDHDAGPDPRQKLVLADDVAFGAGQSMQEIECPAAEPQGRFVAGKLAPPQVEPESAEPDLITGHSIKTVSAAISEKLSS